MPVDLSTNLAGIALRNPIIAASGTCGYVDELADAFDLSNIGAVVTKSITREQREGNPPWRMVEVERGMLNAIGLANVGLERFIKEKLPKAARVNTVVIGSVAGNSIDDYATIASAFDAAPHMPAIELNVSCPNTADGLQFGEHPRKLRELLEAVRPAVLRKKLFVKLSPNVGDIVAMATTAIEAGADGLTLVNTFAAMAIDVGSRKPRLSRGSGGLSGPGIHPIAVRMVHDVYRCIARDASIPIIGLGGVMRWEDAAEFILAGATAVGMGTALFVDPQSPLAVSRGLSKWVERQGCTSISQLIGQVKPT